jgi:hypothetical protein
MYINEIASDTVHVNTEGNPGAATGSADTIPIHGFLLDVNIAYDGGAPATTDITVTEVDTGANLLVVANSNSDAMYTPRRAICDVNGAAQALYDLVPIHGPVRVTVQGSDELMDCAIVTIRWITP